MSATYDRARLMELFGNDPETLAEIERDFVATVRLAEREIAGTDDMTDIARAAHRLKGASGMVGAASLVRIAEAVEGAVRSGDLLAIRRLRQAFSSEVARVAAEIAAGCQPPLRGRSITVAE